MSTKPFPVISDSMVGGPESIIPSAVVNSVYSESRVGSPITIIISRNTFFDLMETDLQDVFINSDEFADAEVIYNYKDGTSFTFNAIFDDEYLTVDSNTDVGVMSSDPVLITQESKFQKSVNKGDTVEVRGNLYRVQRPEPDGTGLLVIYLQLDKS